MSGILVKDDHTADVADDLDRSQTGCSCPLNQHTPPFTFQSVAPTYEEVKGHRYQIIQPHKWDPAAVRLGDRCHPSNQPVKIAALQSNNKVPFNLFSMNHQLV